MRSSDQLFHRLIASLLPSKKFAAFGFCFASLTADFSDLNIDSIASDIVALLFY